MNGETKVYDTKDIELDNDDDSQSISIADAMNLAQAIVNERRAKKK